jgi:hypothetical protein
MSAAVIMLGVVALAGGFYTVWRWPTAGVGIVLAIMPLHFLAVELGQFYGVPQITALSGATKEIPLLLLTFVLWRRNGIKFGAPDYFILACFTLAALRTAFGGTVAGLRDDFAFLIPYFLGRVTVLAGRQERLWARRAVWVAAALSIAGVAETLVIGPLPRELLYAAVNVNRVATSPDRLLPSSFYASNFEGIRAASTMVGPPSFAALCMIALIIWWVYLRNPLPAALMAAGLICALTRSAWIGTGLAILVLAPKLGQKRRLAGYALLVVALFAVAIPILDIHDYVSTSRSGQEASEQFHRENVAGGLTHIIAHPLGSGAGNVGPAAGEQNANVVVTENTYLGFAAEYGMPVALCFLGFLLSALRHAWQREDQLGYLAVGILIGFSAVMSVLLIHEDLRLACWVWFPVGLSLRRVPVVRPSVGILPAEGPMALSRRACSAQATSVEIG